MTTQINRDDKFLGFPATRLKTLLASWEKGNNYPSGLSDLKALSLTNGACAAFLGESLHRKYIDIGHHEGRTIEESRERRLQFLELTRAGEAIVSASARKRLRRQRRRKSSMISCAKQRAWQTTPMHPPPSIRYGFSEASSTMPNRT